MKKCSNCGKELCDSDRFCVSCMTSLDHKTTVQGLGARSLRPSTLLIILGLILSCIAVFLCYLGVVNMAIDDEKSDGSYSTSVSDMVDNSIVSDDDSGFDSNVNIDEDISYSYIVGGTSIDMGVGIGEIFIAQDSILVTGPTEISPTGEYTIPSEIDGYRVVGVIDDDNDRSFTSEEISSTLISVSLPDTVLYIAGNVFRYCSLLEHLYISSESIYICDSALPYRIGSNKTLNIHCPVYCFDVVKDKYLAVSSSVYGAKYNDWSSADQ